MYQNGNATDWIDEATRLGSQQQHDINVSGGSENVQYYISGSILDVKGIAKNDDFQRITGRINVSASITEWLTLGTNTQVSEADRSGDPASFGGAFYMNPLTRAYTDEGELTIFPWPEDIFSNPLGNLNNIRDDKLLRIFTNNYLDVKLNFIPGLSYRLNTGFNYRNRNIGRYQGRNTVAGFTNGGVANVTSGITKDILIENILSYTKDFGEHTLNFTGLYSFQKINDESHETQSQGFPNDVMSYYQPGLGTLIQPSSSYAVQNYISYMGRINYSFKNKYLLTLTGRRDGYSAQWLRAGPQEWLVKEILMIKNMNANTIRMSIHHGMKGGVNDPRLAEIGDQLGVMFQWTTGTWVRTASPWILDFEGLPKYVKQVRNHPSIVMWQPANHPKYVDFDTETIPWYEKVYVNIYPHDPSRLINPAANITRSKGRNDKGTLDRQGNQVEPEPVWTAPMITRGDMDHATGYGAEWSVLRMYPNPPDWSGAQGWREAGYRTDYLNSQERAYFDFENEESIGQPNWNLRKGKPSYQIKSYELKYDVGSIGRQLTVEEWQESQAWQAFSAFEAYKKKRWLDYDGLAWCTLHGGGNTATYQKPLIDYYGHAKLAYHAVKMVLQSTLAGSYNVDMVYGPDDQIEPVIMHLGEERVVSLTVTLKNMQGETIEEKKYENIKLIPGRTVKKLPAFKPDNLVGYYSIHYEITF